MSEEIHTVGALIEALQKFDPSTPIELPLQTYTQAYPSLYVRRITWVKQGPDGQARLWVHLGEGFIISERKKKS